MALGRGVLLEGCSAFFGEAVLEEVGLGWREALPEPGVVLAGSREGFHGDPAGSAIPGLLRAPRSGQGCTAGRWAGGR